MNLLQGCNSRHKFKDVRHLVGIAPLTNPISIVTVMIRGAVHLMPDLLLIALKASRPPCPSFPMPPTGGY